MHYYVSAIDNTSSLLDNAKDMHIETFFSRSALLLCRTVRHCSQSNLSTTNCIVIFPKGIHTQNLFHNRSSFPWFSSDYRRHINWHLPSWFSIQSKCFYLIKVNFTYVWFWNKKLYVKHCLFKHKLIFIILKLSDIIFDININIISNSP